MTKLKKNTIKDKKRIYSKVNDDININFNAIFCHSNKFDYKDGRYYSNGIFINDNLKRYTDVFGYLLVISRKKEANNINKLVLIDNPLVRFDSINSLSSLFNKKVRNNIKEKVSHSTYIIARVPSIVSFLTIHYAKLYKKPYMVEVVGDAFGALWYHGLIGKLIAPLEHLLCKYYVKKSAFALYVTRNYLQKIYSTKVETINCSNVELEKFDDSVIDNRIKTIEKLEDNSNIIISTIASIDAKYKGQHNVIKAISKLKKLGYHFSYNIIGNGNKDRLEKLIIKYNVSDCVNLVGGVPHNEIFDVLDKTNIYIQPSLGAEGLPRSMIEAMSRGCLCIGTNICGIPELIDKKFIYSKNNIKQLIKILMSINKEDYKKQAIINFEESKKYSKEVLSERRKKFFNKYKNYVDML